MKIMFLLSHYGYARHYVGVIKEFAQRGHEVDVYFNRAKRKFKRLKSKNAKSVITEKNNILDYEGGELIETLICCKELNKLELSPLPKRKDKWVYFARNVRSLRDFIRYFHPDLIQKTKLKHRASLRINPLFISFINFWHLLLSYKGLIFIDWILQSMEKFIPTDKSIEKILKDISPDILLLTPGIELQSAQIDYQKAAQKLKIFNILCVASWDNLTTKGIIQIKSDKTFVWNKFQKQEAIKFHGLTDSQVVVTGAQSYDEWFSRKQKFTYSEFCQKVGLNGEQEYILYVCSSPFIAAHEVFVVKKLIEILRTSENQKLKQVQLLVRPHPQNAKQWMELEGTFDERSVIYPKAGQYVLTDDSKELYFHSLLFSKLVIGINTSAMVESSIFKKPVLTITLPEFFETQEGTYHFHYLKEEGLLDVALNFDELKENILMYLIDPNLNSDRREKFVREFIRPYGREMSAVSKIINEINSYESYKVTSVLGLNDLSDGASSE